MDHEYIVDINEDNFDACVLQEEKLVLLDFWAPWCGPCRMISPLIRGIAQGLDGAMVVGKINVDEHVELAARFGVMSIPTLVLIKDGHVVDTMIGAGSPGDILGMVNAALADSPAEAGDDPPLRILQ
ncbi:MAG: thioredoxin [Oscillospiraceae bacterium]|jgi:thioredoxin 1|nr:thioredoxin [Oscillospiraceae bacterium]